MQSAPQALTLSAVVVWQRPWRFCSPEATCPERGLYPFAAAEKPPYGASQGGLNPVLLLPLRHSNYCTPGKQTSRLQSFIGILLYKAPPPLCWSRHMGRHVCLLPVSGLGAARKSRVSGCHLQSLRFLRNNV